MFDILVNFGFVSDTLISFNNNLHFPDVRQIYTSFIKKAGNFASKSEYT
ncbi:1223_t:CDS:2 [Funneliformis mosseae]|uniref:1223_t:CDS:1 n=1 Tax=Funneliformis mosseae TaxID=27381 RepID=A0A9N8VA13_FUNMO|nr:1223_t:CDS:2 [Funneliformis mosseae]